MTERLLLVDLENVQTMDLSHVPPDARVWVFYGVTQKKLPTELVVQAQPFGARLQWIKISGQGKNALDFHASQAQRSGRKGTLLVCQAQRGRARRVAGAVVQGVEGHRERHHADLPAVGRIDVHRAIRPSSLTVDGGDGAPARGQGGIGGRTLRKT